MQIGPTRMHPLQQAMMPVAVPAAPGDDCSDVQIEMVPVGPPAIELPTEQGEAAALEAGSNEANDAHRSFAQLAAQVAAPVHVGASSPRPLDGRAPGNAAFATGFDRAPAHTPAGRNDAASVQQQGFSPQLSRALAAYGASRAAR